MTNGDLRETRKQFFSGIRGRFSDPLYFLLKRRWMTPYGTPVSRESCRGTEGGTEGQVDFPLRAVELNLLSKRVWRCNPVPQDGCAKGLLSSSYHLCP